MVESRTWEKVLVVFFIATLVAFSTDLRIGLNLQLNARPDFQFFELVFILFGALLILVSPWVILKGSVSLKNEDHILVFFLINAAILALWSEDILHNISRTKDFFWAFSLYVLLRYGPLSLRSLAVLIRLSVLIASAWSILGLVQWMGWDAEFGGDVYQLFLASQALYKTVVDPFAGEVVLASFAHGLYLYPQNFIYYLLAPFFLGLGLAWSDRRWLIPTAVIFAAMLGTLSKTFLLLLAIFVGLFALKLFYRNIPVAIMAFVGLAGLAVLSVLLFGDYRFWKQALGTFTWRLEIWADSLQMLGERPWLMLAGDGTELLRAEYSRVNYPNPHNMFIYFLIEYGMVGVTLFFVFLFGRFRKLWGELAHASFEARALFWGLVLFVSMGLVDDLFVQTQITALIFFYLGLLTRLIEHAGVETEEPAGRRAVSPAAVA